MTELDNFFKTASEKQKEVIRCIYAGLNCENRLNLEGSSYQFESSDPAYLRETARLRREIRENKGYLTSLVSSAKRGGMENIDFIKELDQRLTKYNKEVKESREKTRKHLQSLIDSGKVNADKLMKMFENW